MSGVATGEPRVQLRKPPLTVAQILAWADSHRAAHGRWPRTHSGEVGSAPRETWLAVDDALRVGCRGLPGGSSLARLLAESRHRCPTRSGCRD